MDLAQIHGRIGTTVVLFTVLAGVWALVAALRRRPVEGSTWGIVAVGEILFLAQGAIGVILYLEGQRPSRGLHILYGAITTLALPAYYAISKGRDDNRAQWIYALLFFFLTAIAVRAITTAG
jgi:hypothetical protein